MATNERISDGFGKFYTTHVEHDGSAFVFEERGHLVSNRWHVAPNEEINPRIPATVRERVKAAIAEGRYVLGLKVAA